MAVVAVTTRHEGGMLKTLPARQIPLWNSPKMDTPRWHQSRAVSVSSRGIIRAVYSSEKQLRLLSYTLLLLRRAQ